MNDARPDLRTDAFGFAKHILKKIWLDPKTRKTGPDGNLCANWGTGYLNAGFSLNVVGTYFEIRDRDSEEMVSISMDKGFHDHQWYHSAGDMLEMIETMPLPGEPSEGIRETTALVAGLAVHHMMENGIAVTPDIDVLIIQPLAANQRNHVHLRDRNGIIEEIVASPALRAYAARIPPKATMKIRIPDAGSNRANERIVHVGAESMTMTLADLDPVQVMKALAKAPQEARWMKPEWS
jgi:hypothetical protein